MRSLASALSTELDAHAHAGLALCIELALETPIYRTTWNRPIAFDGDTYAPDVFSFGEVGGALRPVSPAMPLSFQNLRDPVTDTERPWSARLSSEDMNGVVVSVRVVMLSQLSDTTAQIDETDWRVRGAARLRGNFCDLELGPAYDLARLYVPEASLRAPWCFHEWGDGLCRGDRSRFASCDRNLGACMARHPQLALRFSQYPYDQDMRRVG